MPHQDNFTHKFSLDFGEGNYIKGQIEFDTDHKTSFKIIKMPEYCSEELMGIFMKWVADVKTLYRKHGDIKEIKLIKKEE